MSSYGEGDSAHGRAQVGRAQVGRVQVGQLGRAQAPAGRASIPGSAPAQNGTAPRNGAAGRASVGAPAAGSASVGRASVGRVGAPPISPAGPVGPIGPGGAGPGRGGLGTPGRGPEQAKRRKKARRRNWIIAAFAVFIMLAGGAVVAGTYYYDSVPPPEELQLPESSSILYANGTQLAKLGQEDGGNREIVPISAIPKHVQDAVISAEDRNFYKHGGVDYRGIMRAAWNNLTGGETQGASTITQQYAREAAHLTGITYGRKVREAVIASKLNQEYTKEQILSFYLNTIYLGRGAYGIQAASRAYFNKTVDKLTPAEGAVLAALIKQPEASATFKGYDPTVNPGPAKERWDYVIDGMVKAGSIPEADRAKIQYPTTVLKKAPACVTAATCGVDTPVGNVVTYVGQELAAMGITDLKAGGYRVTTTIDPKMQKAAEEAARPVKGSPMYGQNKKTKDLMAAMVAIDPRNGRVKAYYGGDKGTDYDYAGLNTDPKTGAMSGTHSPGSTFKIYTMAAALNEGISTDSHWDALKLTDPDTGRKLTNAGRDTNGSVSCAHWCTLEESAIQSYNVPFYYITKEIGPAKVVDAAKAAGVRNMTPDDGKMVDLTKVSGEQVAPSRFNTEVGFGQYGITVLDHANGMATFAAGGIYHKAHFVVKVEKKGEDGKYKVLKGVNEKGERRFPEDKIDDLNAVLQKIPDHNNDDLDGDRPATGKTGTWQLGNTSDNRDAWMIGATPQLATAVWIGTKGNPKPIVDKNGVKIGGSGLPADVWKDFMNAATKGTDVERFAPAQHTGDNTRGNGIQPAGQPGQDGNCFLPAIFCPTDNGGNNGGNTGPGGGRRGGG